MGSSVAAEGTNHQSLSDLQKQAMTPNELETQFLDNQDVYSQFTLKNVGINQASSTKRMGKNPIITNGMAISDQAEM